MVFESLVNPGSAEQRPWVTFVLGFVFSLFAVMLGIYIFSTNASLALVFFTALFFIPLFYKTMIYEEQKDIKTDLSEEKLLVEHSKAVLFFMYLILGMTLGFMAAYIILDASPIMHMGSVETFQIQTDTINQINAHATQPLHTSLSYALRIFENNIKVMVFCILFSLMFGAGAIFILTWNASVIGAALGSYVTKILAVAAGTGGIILLKASGCALLRYLVHGIPEILAYFVGGLAGGIISVALINHDYGTKKFERVMIDATYLIMISVGIILIATLMEVFLTPLIICTT